MRTAQALVLVTCVTCGGAAWAAEGADKADAAKRPRVTGVEPKQGRMGDQLTIHVENLTDWLKDKGVTGPARADLSKITLFLNGRPLEGVHPTRISVEGQDLIVVLPRAAEPRAAWATLLGGPKDFTLPLRVSLAYEREAPIDTDVKEFPFVAIDRGWFVAGVVMLLLALALFVWLAVRSDVLRDPGPQPADGQRKPFSLAYTQMAVWSFLVFASFLLIWNMLGEMTVSTSVLILMGISAGTTVGAVLVGSGKRAAQEAERLRLTAHKQELEAAIADRDRAIAQVAAGTQPDPVPRLAAERSAARQQLNQVNEQIAPSSHGFFRDILGGPTGVSLHRFQIAVWTVVLAVVFAHDVYTNLAMPNLDGTLLALMGISSAAYVTLKVPEG